MAVGVFTSYVRRWRRDFGVENVNLRKCWGNFRRMKKWQIRNVGDRCEKEKFVGLRFVNGSFVEI